jgi:hypothetical protein
MYRTQVSELQRRISRARETIAVTQLIADREPATRHSAARLISEIELEIADLERELGALRGRTN